MIQGPGLWCWSSPDRSLDLKSQAILPGFPARARDAGGSFSTGNRQVRCAVSLPSQLMTRKSSVFSFLPQERRRVMVRTAGVSRSQVIARRAGNSEDRETQPASNPSHEAALSYLCSALQRGRGSQIRLCGVVYFTLTVLTRVISACASKSLIQKKKVIHSAISPFIQHGWTTCLFPHHGTVLHRFLAFSC